MCISLIRTWSGWHILSYKYLAKIDIQVLQTVFFSFIWTPFLENVDSTSSEVSHCNQINLWPRVYENYSGQCVNSICFI